MIKFVLINSNTIQQDWCVDDSCSNWWWWLSRRGIWKRNTSSSWIKLTESFPLCYCCDGCTKTWTTISWQWHNWWLSKSVVRYSCCSNRWADMKKVEMAICHVDKNATLKTCQEIATLHLRSRQAHPDCIQSIIMIYWWSKLTEWWNYEMNKN